MGAVKRILTKLKQLQIIVVERFNAQERDQTNWYSIEYDCIPTFEQSGSESTPGADQGDPVI